MWDNNKNWKNYAWLDSHKLSRTFTFWKIRLLAFWEDQYQSHLTLRKKANKHLSQECRTIPLKSCPSSYLLCFFKHLIMLFYGHGDIVKPLKTYFWQHVISGDLRLDAYSKSLWTRPPTKSLKRKCHIKRVCVCLFVCLIQSSPWFVQQGLPCLLLYVANNSTRW